MPARTRGRAKFDFRGRPFVWWVDSDRWLRIASLDKRFVIAWPLGRRLDEPSTILVVGQEFPGIDAAEARPVRLLVPERVGPSMGAWVDHLLRWSFDPAHERVRYAGPVLFS
jgi:hypothetical protein